MPSAVLDTGTHSESETESEEEANGKYMNMI